jgi:hypothetical protein
VPDLEEESADAVPADLEEEELADAVPDLEEESADAVPDLEEEESTDAAADLEEEESVALERRCNPFSIE